MRRPTAFPVKRSSWLLGLSSLQYLTILAPIGLFLGLLLALARLNSDSEMAALNACGVGPMRILRPLMLLCTFLSIGIAWLSLQQAPAAVQAIETLEREAQEAMDLNLLQAGKFSSPDGGDTVIYAQEVLVRRSHQRRFYPAPGRQPGGCRSSRLRGAHSQ